MIAAADRLNIPVIKSFTKLGFLNGSVHCYVACVVVPAADVEASTEINAWSTAEPSSFDYGAMMEAQRKRLETRYEPFIVKPVYFDTRSVNHSGYRITLHSNLDSYNNPMDAEFAPDAEWIAIDNGLTFDRKLELYGPFEANEVRGYADLTSKIKEFDGSKIDNVMNYLFETVDFEEFGYDE